MALMNKDEKLAEEYEKAVGRPPDNRFFEDPDWNYRGTKEEREALKRRLEIWEDAEEPVLIEGQMSLGDA